MAIIAPAVSPIFYTHVQQQRIQATIFKHALMDEIASLEKQRAKLREDTLSQMNSDNIKVAVDLWLARIKDTLRLKSESSAYNADLYIFNGDRVQPEWSDMHPDKVNVLVEDGDDRRPIYDLAPKLESILTLENLFDNQAHEWLKSLRNNVGALYEVTTVHITSNFELNHDDGDNYEVFIPVRVDWKDDEYLWAYLQTANCYYLEVEGLNKRIAQLQGVMNQLQEMRDSLGKVPDPESPGSEKIEFEDGSSF